METQSLHRGRLIDHVQLVVRDLDASRTFYDAVFNALGLRVAGEGPGFFWIDELFVSAAGSAADQGVPTGRVHLAFQARDRATVVAVHEAGLKGGGTDNGAAGERPYHPGYYAAFLIDPDGNNIEAVHHGPHARSSDGVVVTFEQ